MNQNNEPPKIVFEGEEFQQSARSFQVPTPKIVQWVIKYSDGLVKDKKQASYVLIGFVVLTLVIVIILLSNTFGGPSKPPSGFRGNIPNSPEYQNPPTPEDLR